MPHISLAAEELTTVFGLPITNSIVMTWMVMGLLALFAFFATKNISLIPTKMQVVAESIIGGLYDLFKNVTGEHVDTFFPLLASIFFFVIIGNWIGLVPGVGSIGLVEEVEVHEQVAQNIEAEEVHKTEEVDVDMAEEIAVAESAEEEHGPKFVPILRGPTADLNTTLALAIVAVVAIQFFGFKTLGHKYSHKFINFKDPINFFVGILEIVSEFAKIVSFAFRLFGNIFAGEVLLAVVAFLVPVIAPLPFIGLEIFVGFIQALVFAMLTAVFLNVATQEH